MQSEFTARDSQLRAGRRLTRPTISIVLASSQPRATLDACVSTLLTHCAGSRAELIVARADSALHLGMLGRTYPLARFVPAPAECTIGDLRMYGMRAATGDIVLLFDDGTMIDELFVDKVLAQVTGHGTDQHGEHAVDRSPSNVKAQPRRESLRAAGES
jgi:hypothetical protein